MNYLDLLGIVGLSCLLIAGVIVLIRVPLKSLMPRVRQWGEK